MHGLERDQYCDLGLLICPLVILRAAKVSFGERAEAQSPQRRLQSLVVWHNKVF